MSSYSAHDSAPKNDATDGDKLADGWELDHGFDPLVNNDTDGIQGNGAGDDPDDDGLLNFDEYLNGSDPSNGDTDGDGVWDSAEVAQGSDPTNSSDNGQPPPPEDILELPFRIYGDWAAWEMTVEGRGPSDRRVFKLSTDAPGGSATAVRKLHKGNSYRLTMSWLGSGEYTDPYWYCWEAKIGGLPNQQTYQSYNSTRIPGAATTVVGEGWFADNAGGLLTAHVHMNDDDGGNVAEGLEAILYVPKLEFLESAGTRYNFSPSLGEEAAVDVKVTPAPPEDGFPGVHFRLGIVRETAGGGEQEIDWLDVDDTPAYSRVRAVDFQQKRFTWNGIPNPSLFGNSAPQASGRDSFQGVSDSAVRILPAVTAGQPVPPPFVTAVAKIVSNSDQSTVCEARKRICIPQVVKLVYDADAITLIKQGHSGYTNGVPCLFIDPMSDAEWETQRGRIRTIAQTYYDATAANIRFVDERVNPTMPYSALRMRYVTGDFGSAPTDFLNESPIDAGKLNAVTLKNAIGVYWDSHQTMSLPVTATEVGFLWGLIAVHECGHLLGLVSPGDVLDGSPGGTGDDVTGWHNKNPSGKRVMNPGRANTLEQMLKREGDWSWKGMNADYLRFVLPKE
jgi:hypothetical protein